MQSTIEKLFWKTNVYQSARSDCISRQIENYETALMNRLDKEDRKLLLQILDAKDMASVNRAQYCYGKGLKDGIFLGIEICENSFKA